MNTDLWTVNAESSDGQVRICGEYLKTHSHSRGIFRDTLSYILDALTTNGCPIKWHYSKWKQQR